MTGIRRAFVRNDRATGSRTIGRFIHRLVAIAAALFVGPNFLFAQFDAVLLEASVIQDRDGIRLEESQVVEFFDGSQFFYRKQGTEYVQSSKEEVSRPMHSEGATFSFEDSRGSLVIGRGLPHVPGRFFYDGDPKSFYEKAGTTIELDAVEHMVSVYPASRNLFASSCISRFLASPKHWFDDVEMPNDVELKIHKAAATGVPLILKDGRLRIEATKPDVAGDQPFYRLSQIRLNCGPGDQLHGYDLPNEYVQRAMVEYGFSWDDDNLTTISMNSVVTRPDATVRTTTRQWEVSQFFIGDAARSSAPTRTLIPPDGTDVHLADQSQIDAEWRDGRVVKVFDSGVVEELDAAEFMPNRNSWVTPMFFFIVAIGVAFAAVAFVRRRER